MSETARDALIERIAELKQQRHAVILAHNYQREEVQRIADYTGDSLELARRAARTTAEVIVFCGVTFMAETAAVLCPGRLVLLPDLRSGCPMADMIDGAQLRAWKQEHPGALVVCYVNSTAEVKAESDICCTSANAIEVVQSLPADREVLFVPDQYLGGHVQRQTGRSLVLWPGFCPTHQRITAEAIAARRAEYPGAPVLVHPECTPEAAAAADAVLSTGGMCRYASGSPASTLLIGTETGILFRLGQENPGKRFVPVTEDAVCPNMKRITLEKIRHALEELTHPITVPEDTAHAARAALERMLALG
ncbi:MAG: quinolinate synthase NadA [Myxococcota bacterium]|jgi:quinolinate synthase|nr:quinolinate synthase NadA [Myxococcota bacterium]